MKKITTEFMNGLIKSNTHSFVFLQNFDIESLGIEDIKIKQHIMEHVKELGKRKKEEILILHCILGKIGEWLLK